MALALYRKYRPATFAEVVGQEHVTAPLVNAVDGGRINHAYLFSGPRGCGKTSSARILARSLNCEQGPTSTPCGVCGSCVALAPDGPGSLDVIEIDAASHGGVDDARDLRERAFFAPVSSRYKVYIVDEAHMVTTQGFNALLKVVEEPPEFLVFVFATTEPDKVLPTIRSRTHHYPFRLVPPTTLRGLLEKTCQAEGVAVEPTVFPLVVRAGGGSVRDSLSILDQLLAGAGPEGVTYRSAVGLLGVTDDALLDETIDALAAHDAAGVFRAVDRVVEAGHDPRRFATDLLDRLRDLIVLDAVPDAGGNGLLDSPTDRLDLMSQQAQALGSATLSRMADTVHEGLTEMRGTTAPRLLLELVCARMMLPGTDGAAVATLQRLERLERRMSIAGEHAGLHRRADGDDLVRVDALVGLLAAGQLLHQVGDGGHAGGAADEDHVVDVGDLDAGLLDDVLERLAGALEQVLGEVLELGAGQVLVQMHRALGGHGQVLQRDAGGGGRGELLLGLLRGLLQALQGDLVLGQVRALGLGLLEQPVHDPLIPVVAAEAVVAGGGAHLDGGEVVLVLGDLEQGHVEGAAAQVEDQDELVLLALLQAVGQRGRGGLVDDALDVQARDLAGLLGGLALGVVEVGGHGDHRVGDLLAQVLLGVVLELHQRAGRDLLRGVLLAVHLGGPVGAHVALDGRVGALRVVDGLALGDLADQDLTALRESDHRGGGAGALGVRDDGGLATFQDGDHRVGGAQVDADGVTGAHSSTSAGAMTLASCSLASCGRRTSVARQPRWLSVPLGPLTVTLAPSMVTSTPLGMATGSRPIRDMLLSLTRRRRGLPHPHPC